MIEKCRAIVLTTIKCASGPTLVKLFTELRGILTVSIPAARSKKSALKHNLFHPLALLAVEVEYRENKEVHRLVGAEVSIATHSLLTNPAKLTLALFVAELIHKAVRQQENDEALFLFLMQSVEVLDLSHESVANFHLLFMLKLSIFLGFFPQTEPEGAGYYFDLINGRFTSMLPLHPHYRKGPEVRHLETLIKVGYTDMASLRLSRQERNDLLDLLIAYYHRHLNPLPALKTLDVLRSLFV